jgi:hypothetical protein
MGSGRSCQNEFSHSETLAFVMGFKWFDGIAYFFA